MEIGAQCQHFLYTHQGVPYDIMFHAVKLLAQGMFTSKLGARRKLQRLVAAVQLVRVRWPALPPLDDWDGTSAAGGEHTLKSSTPF